MRFLAFLIMVFATFPTSAQEIFKNEKYGFSMEEPKGWIKITDKRLDYNLAGQHGYHIISFSKFDPKKSVGLNPIISVNAGVNWRPFEELGSGMMQPRNYKNQTLSGFSPLRTPEIISIQNLKAIHRVDEYTIRGRKGGKFTVKRKSYIVPSGKYVFHIDLIDGQNLEDETKLFEKLIESIKFYSN